MMHFLCYKYLNRVLHIQVTISVSAMAVRYNKYTNRGTCGVIVIIIANGHDDTSSNPRWGWLHFT